MELSERQVQITELLRKSEYLAVEVLAEKYRVTTQTIRRDLATLCDHGLARRRHGGIERPLKSGNLSYDSRQVLARREKLAIAREVARHIPDGASVAFSIGTTPELVASALLRHQRLRIFTNNLQIAMLACANPTFEVNIAGGRIRNSETDVLGTGTEEFLSSYRFDFGVYGVAGVAEDGTLLDFHEDEVRARRAIHDNSLATFLVLDHSKFGRAAHVVGGRIEEAGTIFCDARPPGPIMEMVVDSGSKFVLCEPGEEA